MNPQLSQGAIKAMYQNDNCQSPVVQVIDIKRIQGPNAPQPERFRLVISDGIHYQQAMLATQLNNLIKDNSVSNNCVVRLKEFICNTVHNRRIVIVLNLEVVGSLSAAIGTPANIEQAMGGVVQPQPMQTVQNNAPPQMQPPQGVPKGPQAYQPKPAPQQQQNFQQQRPQQPAQGFRPPQQQFGVSQNSQQIQPQLSGEPSTIYPIKSLNPYQNRWTIKARVTSKSDVRTWQNNRGNGRLFSIDLLDNTGGEIRATMFNDAVDKFYPILEVNKVYYISKGTLKIANKKFSSIHNEYELTLDSNAIVQLCNETTDIPLIHLNLIPISAIAQVDANDVIDVMGVVLNTGDLISITTKAGKETKKRNVTLVDTSNCSIELSLWGDKAENIQWYQNDHPVLAVKGAKVSTYGGRTLGTVNSTILEVNPDQNQAQQLQSWWAGEGCHLQANSLSQQRDGKQGGGDSGPTVRKLFSEVKEEMVGSTKPLFCEVKGTITSVRHEGNLWYQACPSQGCNKKVVQSSNGYWHCDTCNADFEAANPRYLLSLAAADTSGSQWLSAFNEVGEVILGVPASQLEHWRDTKDPRFEAVFFDAVLKQYKFKIKAVQETYMDQPKLKCTIMTAKPINFVEESSELINRIHQFSM